MLSHYSHWRPIGIATLSHGYGMSVTPLQLAHAYATIGAGGIGGRFPSSASPVRSPASASWIRRSRRSLVQMMEQVVAAGGTGTRAAVVGYRVAGKTGTAWKSFEGGYSTDKIHGGPSPVWCRPRIRSWPPWS
jgi:cell division protein FtsI (penicillin-binding protein 3)